MSATRHVGLWGRALVRWTLHGAKILESILIALLYVFSVLVPPHCVEPKTDQLQFFRANFIFRYKKKMIQAAHHYLFFSFFAENMTISYSMVTC